MRRTKSVLMAVMFFIMMRVVSIEASQLLNCPPVDIKSFMADIVNVSQVVVADVTALARPVSLVQHCLLFDETFELAAAIEVEGNKLVSFEFGFESALIAELFPLLSCGVSSPDVTAEELSLISIKGTLQLSVIREEKVDERFILPCER